MPLEYTDELNGYGLCLESFIPDVLNSATTSISTLITVYVSKEEKLTKKFYTSTKSIYYLQQDWKMDTDKLAIPFLSAIQSFSERQGKMVVSHQLLQNTNSPHPCTLLDSAYKTSSKCTFSPFKIEFQVCMDKGCTLQPWLLWFCSKAKHIPSYYWMPWKFIPLVFEQQKEQSEAFYQFRTILKWVKKQLCEEKFHRFHMVTLTCTGQTVLVNESLAPPRHMPGLTVTDKYIFLSSGITHRHPLFLLNSVTIWTRLECQGNWQASTPWGSSPKSSWSEQH